MSTQKGEQELAQPLSTLSCALGCRSAAGADRAGHFCRHPVLDLGRGVIPCLGKGAPVLRPSISLTFTPWVAGPRGDPFPLTGSQEQRAGVSPTSPESG